MLARATAAIYHLTKHCRPFFRGEHQFKLGCGCEKLNCSGCAFWESVVLLVIRALSPNTHCLMWRHGVQRLLLLFYPQMVTRSYFAIRWSVSLWFAHASWEYINQTIRRLGFHQFVVYSIAKFRLVCLHVFLLQKKNFIRPLFAPLKCLFSRKRVTVPRKRHPFILVMVYYSRNECRVACLI